MVKLIQHLLACNPPHEQWFKCRPLGLDLQKTLKLFVSCFVQQVEQPIYSWGASGFSGYLRCVRRLGGSMRLLQRMVATCVCYVCDGWKVQWLQWLDGWDGLPCNLLWDVKLDEVALLF